MTELFAPVVSIAKTQRGRFFWAAWWTEPPALHPFRKPDASNGGASTYEEAKQDAERVAARALVEVDARWARACVRVMRGMPPFTPSELRAAREGASEHVRARRAPVGAPQSLWSVLGVDPKATVAEIKRAYRARALETHPDQGGDPDAFRALHAAYERAIARRDKQAKRPKKRAPE
ncbi:J domain-containing protein [Sandaracinus amylolyticus]|uniref:J domain-containing protein n=1 Tax=Sandaracinus amylolyticus TaxID=927083 RepID=A0A0F6VZ27_9BACT|nr:J domain-containing protein [Sandaracinus amylolyticus]AKF03102.1 hypothetical protein DB32_000251 [Sandaracinus amylolyticus]